MNLLILIGSVILLQAYNTYKDAFRNFLLILVHLVSNHVAHRGGHELIKREPSYKVGQVHFELQQARVPGIRAEGYVRTGEGSLSSLFPRL